MHIVMPKLGLTMTEGTLTRWLVAEGQSVRQGDILFEFESEKSALEFECPADGVIGMLLIGEGEIVPCGTPVAMLETVKRAGEGSQHVKISPASINATPAARRLASQRGLDLARVKGRGPNGRIHVADVEMIGSRVEATPAVEATPVARRLAADLGVDLAQVKGSGIGGRVGRDDVVKAARKGSAGLASTATAPEALPDQEFSHKEPLQGVRRVIAQRMSASVSVAPHVTLHTEADATNLVSARQQLNQELAGKGQISFDALFITLVARALREYPQLNAALVDDEIATYRDVNIALAVDTERGLMVPVIRHADHLNVLEIQQAADALVQRALAGKNLPDDLAGGTFTITNLDMFGIDAFTPIINQPQAAILGVGRIVNKPVGDQGQIVLRDRLTLSLSFDHRIVDGGPAARFLQRIGELVERPVALLL